MSCEDSAARQRLHMEQRRLATHQQEVTTQHIIQHNHDQPLDMSLTSSTISHIKHRSADTSAADDDAQLFSGLYLLVDTAMGILEQQQSSNHNMHCNPVLA